MTKKQWEEKINRARRVEREILLWWRKNRDSEAVLSEGYASEHDIISSKGCVEVKEDRLAHQTGNYALEYITHDKKPSGFNGTTSEFFVIVDWEYVLIMYTDILREVVSSMKFIKDVPMGEVFRDGRNRGYLIPREKLLNNPMVTVLERWF
jgi:hypothetical protein